MTELIGYLLYLENWNSDKELAETGWKLFMGVKPTKHPEVSLSEATWIMERTGASAVVMQELRLRLLDRIWIPPVKMICAEN